MREFTNVPVYMGKIEKEIAPQAYLPCFLGAWYRKCVSSTDAWLGIEGVVKLGEFTLDPKRISLDGKGRVMDNPSCYMGGCSEFESDAGVTWSVSFPGSDQNYTLHYTSPKFAFRPFWRNIYIENGKETNKWCQNDPHQPQYYYLPGDVIRMSVYSPEDDYLQLKIEVIEPTTIEKYVKQRERYGLKDNRPSDFVSPLFISPGAGKMNAEYKRVNAIDQYGNEGYHAQMTNATVSQAYWKEVYLYREIDGQIQKVPFTKERYTSMICPSPKAVNVTEDGCDVSLGSEKISIAPANSKE